MSVTTTSLTATQTVISGLPGHFGLQDTSQASKDQTMSNLIFSADGKSAAWTMDNKSFRVDYKIVNGTAYHLQTDNSLVSALELCRAGRTRVEIRLGDDITGRDWMDDRICGLIGRSTGQLKVPIILKTKRSTGGEAVLDHCIVKLIDMSNGAVLWCHPLYSIENSAMELLSTIGEPGSSVTWN